VQISAGQQRERLGKIATYAHRGVASTGRALAHAELSNAVFEQARIRLDRPQHASIDLDQMRDELRGQFIAAPHQPFDVGQELAILQSQQWIPIAHAPS
jgi:hypothetical protein